MMKRDTLTKQRNAVDVAACTCANLRMAARAVSRAYDAALQPTGLKATQFTLLATLDGIGEVPLTQLADALVMDRTTLTRNLKPLVRRGLIDIGPAEDQRVRNVNLTAAGKRVFDDARQHWALAQSRVVESLGPARWSGFLQDLAATVAVVRGG
jgi:DNA-binding MarR family transcriptional regulator